MSNLPSRQDIIDYIAANPGKIGKRELAKAFNLKGSDRIHLKQLLREMSAEGLIESSRKDGMRKAGELAAVGVVEVTGRDSDGNLRGQAVIKGKVLEKPEILVEAKRRQPVIGDQVLARLSRISAQSYTAHVIKIITEKNGLPVIGVVRRDSQGLYLEPVERRAKSIFQISGTPAEPVAEGDLVLGERVEGRRYGPQYITVKQRIGHVDDTGSYSLLALAEQDIPIHFTENVMQEAATAPDTVGLAGREDLRDLPLITIDPADARDHDDAVYAEADSDPKNPGGFHVWVAIADVASYISHGSEMDREARKRGNSVYLPDRVVPMLPERISNDLCSLRPDETRPCLAVKMTIDKTGKRREHRFMRGLMRSAARLSYQQAQAAFDGNPEAESAALHDSVLTPLWQAYQLMAKVRDDRGPLNLDLPERKIIMSNGQVTDIFVPERLEAMRVIEEMMVSANVCAAETLEKHNTPLIYRVHDSPAAEKLHALAGFVKPLGVAIDLGQPMIPRLFNRLLVGAKDSDHSFMVQEAVLRTQAQAVYDPENIGHFGLNLSRYAHFTSPIRRYADLIVHRALIRALRLGDDGLHDSEIENLTGTAEHISATERRAMLAERSAKDRYLSAYLSDKIDRVFDGRVSGLSRSGLFIKLNDTGADGFIPISRLGAERFYADADGLTLSGGTTGTIFRIGMPVRVRLLEATPLVGGLLLELEDSDGNANPPRRRVSRTATGRTKRPNPKQKKAPSNKKGQKRKKSTSRAGRRRAKALNSASKQRS